MKMKSVLTIAAFVLFLTAYGESEGGNSVNDFTKACLTTNNLGPDICKCAGEKAKKELSPNGFAFLVASMEGDESKAAVVRSKLDMNEIAAAGMFMANAPAHCAKEQ